MPTVKRPFTNQKTFYNRIVDEWNSLDSSLQIINLIMVFVKSQMMGCINYKSYLYTKSYWNSSSFYVFLKEHVDQVCLSFFLNSLNLFPFNFIDAEERNANLGKNIKNWILVIFRTCIIHKLTASCLRLSFHLTFKFLVLQTNHQFFPFFFKCKTKIQSGRSHADYSTLKSEALTTKSWCVSLSIWTF